MNKRHARRRLRQWGLILATALLVFSVVLVFARFLLSTRPDEVRPVAVLSGEWEPFVGEGLEGGGPIAQIMSDVLAGAGFEAHLSFTSWDTVDQRTSGGSVFGGFPLVGSDDRRDRMMLSDPIVAFDYVLYMRADESSVPTSANDLAGLRVAGVAGYDYWQALEDSAQLRDVPSTDAGFAALAAGEIDVFAEGTLSAEASLASPSLPLDRTMFQTVGGDAEWATSAQELFFMMPATREARSVMDRINESLAQVQTTPEYADRIASLTHAAHGEVRVIAPAGELVDITDDRGTVIARTLPGAEARVLDWGAALIEADSMIRLKFHSGQAAGTIGFVEAQYLEVTK